MVLSKLYKVDDILFFYNRENRDGRYDPYYVIDNAIIILDIFGNEISRDEAIIEFNKQYGMFIDDVSALSNIYFNIDISKYIISIVRLELLDIQYNQGCTQILEELSDIIPLIQLGMFDTASKILLTKESDIITEEQLIRWSNLLISSDSINKE